MRIKDISSECPACLDPCFSQLFIDWQAPLALSPKVYDNLWRTFDDLHHSIDATISFIQVSAHREAEYAGARSGRREADSGPAQNTYMSHYTTSPAHSLHPIVPKASSPGSKDTQAALQDLQSLECYGAISTEGRSADEVLRAAREGYAEWQAARKEAFHVLVRSMEFWDKRKPLESTLSAVLGEGDGGRGLVRTVDELCNLVLYVRSQIPPLSLMSRLD